MRPTPETIYRLCEQISTLKKKTLLPFFKGVLSTCIEVWMLSHSEKKEDKNLPGLFPLTAAMMLFRNGNLFTENNGQFWTQVYKFYSIKWFLSAKVISNISNMWRVLSEINILARETTVKNRTRSILEWQILPLGKRILPIKSRPFFDTAPCTSLQTGRHPSSVPCKNQVHPFLFSFIRSRKKISVPYF